MAPSSRAMPLPIPRLAPVTTATRSCPLIAEFYTNLRFRTTPRVAHHGRVEHRRHPVAGRPDGRGDGRQQRIGLRNGTGDGPGRRPRGPGLPGPGRGLDALDRIRRKVPDADVHLDHVDLADLASVRTFAAAFSTHHDGLDILVNNAGVMAIPRAETADGFEMQFGTNHLGHVALTGLLLDRLLARPGARVVTVSSEMARMGPCELRRSPRIPALRQMDGVRAVQIGQSAVHARTGSAGRGSGAGVGQRGGSPRLRRHQPAGCRPRQAGRRSWR